MSSTSRKRPVSAMDHSDQEDKESSPDNGFEEQSSPDWTVTYPKQPVTNSSQRLRKIWSAAKEHSSPFHAKDHSKSALNLRYIIEPVQAWQAMRHYTKFVIEKEDYGKLDYVYVCPPDLKPDGKADEKKFWIARILEVRAEDAQHVYALIAWMYWPEQLTDAHSGAETPKSGRRWYHGKHELIASNHLDVMDVTTFAGHAPVAQWLEEDDNDIQEGLYWRQTYNILTGNLSGVRKHCICGKYYNPDLVMLACPNEECHIWLHQECIIDAALTEAYDKLPENPDDKQKRKKVSAKRAPGDKVNQGLSFNDAPYKKRLTGTIIDDGNSISITDLSNNNTWTEKLACLKCGTSLE